MPLYLVRHAKAGSRASWHGEDVDRPLSKTGRSQSSRLAKWLGKEPVSRLLASPYVRCVQTLEPLAERRDLKVEAVDELAEHGPFEPVLDLLERLDDHSVVCTHGDILLATLDALIRRGLVVTGRPDFRKGAIWVVSRDHSEWQTAKAHPPR